MDREICIHLIFLCTFNTLFTFLGVFVNALVILCYWKSSQLQKKLSYFMLMILSCFDLLSVITNHPLLTIYSALWIVDDEDTLKKVYVFVDGSDIFQGFTLLALLTMNFDRYLANAHPLFHRVSITRRRLLAVLVLLLLFEVTLTGISFNNLVITDQIATIIFGLCVAPPLLFINMKLFFIARRMGKRKAAVSTTTAKRSLKLKNISSCLLSVSCLVLLHLPILVYVAVSVKEEENTRKVQITWLWTKSIISTNSTFNCLIFFWKNKILRSEGKRTIKIMTKHPGT